MGIQEIEHNIITSQAFMKKYELENNQLMYNYHKEDHEFWSKWLIDYKELIKKDAEKIADKIACRGD